MNNLRLGMTETTLLFFYYLEQQNINNVYYKDGKSILTNWLYTTSGFYDKKIKGSYFDFNFEETRKSEIYNKYFSHLLNILKNNHNFHLQLCFHNTDPKIDSLKQEFLNIVNYNKHPPISIFSFMENKHILIINNLGSLMKQQFESGNLHKIHPDFPKNIKSIQYFENGYTFFNNGPDSNILETVDNLFNKIQKYDFDGAIISAGAYSCLLAEMIITKLNKTAFVIGGDLSYCFGISCKRNNINNEFWIKVPDNLKPPGYEKIEDGCYW